MLLLLLQGPFLLFARLPTSKLISSIGLCCVAIGKYMENPVSHKSNGFRVRSNNALQWFGGCGAAQSTLIKDYWHMAAVDKCTCPAVVLSVGVVLQF